ncbi:MAG: hypothetical protein IJ366_00510 [Clostridia bacterium]|nr:hypothetical protein [Clostridia bacterium]MBQ7792980.1 hypothetical protein [Clostridia bacterium]
MPNKRPPNAEQTQFRSGAEAVENGQKGGVASGEARRNKKLLRECLEILLEKEMTDKSGKTMSGAEALATKLFAEAMKGNVKAFEVLRDTAGQKPVEKIVVSEIDSDVIEEVERMVNDETD